MATNDMLQMVKHPLSHDPYLLDGSVEAILSGFGTRASELLGWHYEIRALRLPLKVILDGIARGFSDGMRKRRIRHRNADDLLSSVARKAEELRAALAQLTRAGTFVEVTLAWGGDAPLMEPVRRILEIGKQVARIEGAANSAIEMRSTYTAGERRKPGDHSNPVLDKAINQLCDLFIDLVGEPPSGSRKRDGRRTVRRDHLDMSGLGGMFVAEFFRQLARVDPEGVRSAGLTAATLEDRIKRWRLLYGELSQR